MNEVNEIVFYSSSTKNIKKYHFVVLRSHSTAIPMCDTKAIVYTEHESGISIWRSRRARAYDVSQSGQKFCKVFLHQ